MVLSILSRCKKTKINEFVFLIPILYYFHLYLKAEERIITEEKCLEISGAMKQCQMDQRVDKGDRIGGASWPESTFQPQRSFYQ